MKSIRRNALEKLAVLSAKSPIAAQTDLAKLCQKCPSSAVDTNGTKRSGLNGNVTAAKLPMKLSELEVLLALCKAAPLIESSDAARQLVQQLSPYLPESAIQAIASAPGLRGIDPSPYEVLTNNLTSGLLALGLKFEQLGDRVATAVYAYVEGWGQTAATLSANQFESNESMEYSSDGELAKVMTLTLSLLGFLEAATQQARFWNAQERLRIVTLLQDALTDDLMVAVETAQSVVRNSRTGQRGMKEWKRISKHYAAIGRPLGSMILRQAFMRFVVACASLVLCPADQLEGSVLDYLQLHGLDSIGVRQAAENELLEGLVEIASDEMAYLQNESDYIQRVGSAWQQRLASAVKGSIYTTFLCASVYNDEISEPETLMAWLEASLADPVQMTDEELGGVVMKCLPVLAQTSTEIASSLGRTLPRVIVQGGLESRAAAGAADALINVLKLLPEDTVITTLYSLGNVLSSTSIPERATPTPTAPVTNGTVKNRQSGPYGHQNQATGSTISLSPADAEEPSYVYSTVIRTIVGIVRSRADEKITALAISMLVQKIGGVNLAVNAMIVTETARLAPYAAANELKTLLKLYAHLCHEALLKDNVVMLDAVMAARTSVCQEIKIGHALFEPLVTSLLSTIVSKGDAHDGDTKRMNDVELAAQEIAQLLSPLATMVAVNADGNDHDLGETISGMQRDAWFNIVVHGFSLTSTLGKKYATELRTLAQYSQPLIVTEKAEQLESDVELNTVLRRGKSSDHADDQKKNLIKLLPSLESEIKSLSYQEAVFLNTVYLVEDLRASCGDCTKVLTYFLDPKLRTGSVGDCMFAIAKAVVDTYLERTVSGLHFAFSAPYLAQQLAAFLTGCCHRIHRVQQVATSCAEKIIREVPSTLCQKSALVTLLELLSLMWAACLEGDTDEYEWKSTFTSPRANVTLELSDDFEFRRMTLSHFHKCAKAWVLRVLDIAPLDIKGLLQTYLSEYDDESAYGHVSLGRSFALEMGSVIPSTDQRLGAIESEKDVSINTASDFISQYTTRQEYRFFGGGVVDHDEEWVRPNGISAKRPGKIFTVEESIENAKTLLIDLESRTLRQRYEHKHVSIAELRDNLRKAAALLCRVQNDQCAIVKHLVGIPFAVFTKQSIKLGISLWLSVIKENPRMESRILVAVADNWEQTVRKRRGLFDIQHSRHPDPFYVKQDFAPSDKDFIIRKQQQAYNLIAPHFRLVQFLSSHFSATRLCSPHVERIYVRLMLITLEAIGTGKTTNHPLAREVHFHIVLLGLRVLKYSTSLTDKIKWCLKDSILSAALSWFARPPRWSYGGNRLQIKAETHVLSDIQEAIKKMAPISGLKATLPQKSLQDKQDLLSLLLANEQTRLMVWLFPLDYNKRQLFASNSSHKMPTEEELSRAVKIAWAENPSIALELVSRFGSVKTRDLVRWQILNFPQKVIDEPDALELLLGNSLPQDVSFQLKYLLYWAPVNPITAVTLFLPAYGNHPFIIQYAMRALESHSVDVTFFYVPQIVQALRYDVLGYVERYIIEAGKFSQLFAHQIIWNMKANAYKDEDSQIPDPVKPTLDRVMESLIGSFSDEDRDFYEREFSFFNEVTSISGKLRPYIPRPKEEKKQKIEEELRKIKVDVGVYLPSNPDGVVIGIDRKSGKPLQSHAKAPYMATFRIRKDKTDLDEAEGTDTPDGTMTALSENGSVKNHNTYEVWQSAIFKVGDDCRQDVLALQLISAFRGIFHNVGLDVYVNPYRVTATAPGCGVIDVLPNSISRDMLGREAVNGLFDYFVSKYGSEESPRFQAARNNFVKSMASYSVISYLLQFKDRHNGNIMIDDAGHIIHIDFGFCFDIAPGGIRFERAPFKLTSEMIAVMGGMNPPSQSFRWFEELCVKAFLACRQHAEHLIHIVICMLDSGLPCFKPATVQHLRERFRIEGPTGTPSTGYALNEMEAAAYMRELVRKSAASHSTKGYDQFQLLTNGIPY